MEQTLKGNDFERIYRETYYSTLKYITIKCNNIEDINDILQDTYVELFNILKKRTVNVQKCESYINGIATNIIKRHYSKVKKICFVNDEDENVEIADDFDLEQEFITKENAENIWNFIKNKDLITGKIFYLYFIFDMKIADVARELELNESNVKNRIYRTIKQLREEGLENE